MRHNGFFVTGGALLADADSYVQRAADTELLAALRASEFCYVLTTRQMGKTSLTVRAAAQLREEGCAVVVLDLTAFGQNLDVEQWYFSMLSDVGEKLKLEDEMEAYWESNTRRAPLHRFFGAIHDVYLQSKHQPLVIFVDEIDAIRSLREFKADEFFAGIRECYNRRAADPQFKRLTFCLMGVATPSDLISDQRMTPFNIGRGIELGDFSSEEASVLAGGLSPHRDTAHTLLERVIFWTSGHPYLTQRLCAELTRTEAHLPRQVDDVCTRLFLANDERTGDENLQFVRERLLRSELDQAALLDTYARVCRGELVADDHHHPIINELRLCGIVRVAHGRLQSRNRIYSRVFDLKWVREHLPDAEAKRQRAAYYRGVRRVAGSAILVSLVVGAFAMHSREAGQRAQIYAEQATKAAQKQQAAAKEAQALADEARASAKRERAADEARLRQAAQTEAALQRLVVTQGKVQTLLEAFTPLIGQKAGKLIPERAEELVREFSAETTDDPRILIGQAGLRQVCGRLYLRLGNEAKALEQAEAARSLIRAELARPATDQPASWKPDPDGLRKMLHDSHRLVGDVILGGQTAASVGKKTEKDYILALQAYREALQLAHEQIKAQPEDAAWRELYFADWRNLGDSARFLDRNKEAEGFYREAIHELNILHTNQPSASDLDWIKASLHDRLGTLYLAEDDFVKARTEFDEGLRLRESGAGDTPLEDPERLSDIALSFNKLGNLALGQENWKDALAYYERCLAIREKICEQNPRIEWQRHRGFTLSNIAKVLWRSGQNAQALRRAEERFKLAGELREQDPSDTGLQYDYGNALYGYADILLNVKDPALKDWARALEIARQAVTNTNRQDARILVLYAQALRLNNHESEARSAVMEATKLLPPPNQQTTLDKETARELEFETQKLKVSPVGTGPAAATAKAKPNRRR